MRSTVKSAVELLLARGGPAALARGARRERGLVLAYHNVLPDGVAKLGDSSLHLPRADFAEQLDSLTRHYDVVPLDALVGGGTGGAQAGGRPRVAITFDDAYRGAVTVGMRELVRRGLPATIFVAPWFVEESRSFWWDELADPGAGVVPDALRDRVLDELAGKDSEVRRWAAREGVALRPVTEPAARAATEAELRAAAAEPGITLGSHSWSHPNVARLEPDELREELERPLRWLRERFDAGRVLPWLTYPYGRFSPDAERAAAALGYRGAFRVDGGWMAAPEPNAYALPRYNVPSGISRDGFEVRTSGAL